MSTSGSDSGSESGSSSSGSTSSGSASRSPSPAPQSNSKAKAARPESPELPPPPKRSTAAAEKGAAKGKEQRAEETNGDEAMLDAKSKPKAKAAEHMDVDKEPAPKANGRAASPVTTRLHVGHLTRNVTEEHIREIFSTFGAIKSCELSVDKVVNLPRGFAYVEYKERENAEKARTHMDGGQLDGNVLSVQFVLVPRKRSPPPAPLPGPPPKRPASPGPRRDRERGADRDRPPRREDDRGRERPREAERARPQRLPSPPRRRPPSPPSYRRGASPPRGRRCTAIPATAQATEPGAPQGGVPPAEEALPITAAPATAGFPRAAPPLIPRPPAAHPLTPGQGAAVAASKTAGPGRGLIYFRILLFWNLQSIWQPIQQLKERLDRQIAPGEM
ncbi:g11369 [Coccomyxa elongata]